MVTHETEFGHIEIPLAAIASLVGQVTTRTYGVVGMAVPSRASQLAATLTRDPNKGVKITGQHELDIDVYVVVNYGINIASLANSLITAIRYYLEAQLGLKVHQVNVHIQGLRMGSSEEMF